MEKQIVNQGFDKKSKKSNLTKRLSWSIATAILTGVATYIVTGIIKNKSGKGFEKDPHTFNELSENSPNRIDAGNKVFKVRDALRNKLYLRARRRFVTG